MKNKNIVVVIPALNPNKEIMSDFIEKLVKKFCNIVIVNDGSNKKYDDFFNDFNSDKVKVLKHGINLGKGRALKTAFNYILNKYPDIEVITTADSDGQHLVKDIENCSLEALKHKRSLILGTRNFDLGNVPKRSRFGNKTTRNVFNMFIGLKINDTQTGLRSMSIEVAKKFLDTKGERFEYETNMLINCKYKNVPIVEVPIETVYIDNNSESHFNPIKDSISVYKTFIKYILVSLSSFVLDISLFSIFISLFNKNSSFILIATILARIISSSYNYKVNSRLVFRKKNKSSIIRYYILVILSMLISGISVDLIFNNLVNSNLLLIKVIVDIVIFILNFIIQREWVFRSK